MPVKQDCGDGGRLHFLITVPGIPQNFPSVGVCKGVVLELAVHVDFSLLSYKVSTGIGRTKLLGTLAVLVVALMHGVVVVEVISVDLVLSGRINSPAEVEHFIVLVNSAETVLMACISLPLTT